MLASLAPTRQSSAISTRQRHAQTYGTSFASVFQSDRGAPSARRRARPAAACVRAAGRIERSGRGGLVKESALAGSKWSNMPEISSEDAAGHRRRHRAAAAAERPPARHAHDADAGRRQRQRRHLRRLDHGPSRHRRRRPSGQDRQGPDRHRRRQPVHLQAAGLDGRPAQLLRPRRAHRQHVGHRQRRGLSPSAIRPTCTSSR